MKSIRLKITLFICAGFVGTLNGLAHAVPIVYFGENLTPGSTVSGSPVTARNNFLADLVGVGSENFEGTAAGTTPPLALTFPGSSGSITATIASASGGVCSTATGAVGGISCNGLGRFPTSGTNWYHTNDVFTITFSNPIAAFGFYGTDIGDFDGQVTATLNGGTTVSLTIPNMINAPDGSLLFWGFIDSTNSYTSLQFGNTASGSDVFGFDDLVIGDRGQVAIPEPATLALFGLGFATLGAMRRKKLVFNCVS